MRKRQKKTGSKISEKGAAMLLALFTVVILAAVSTAFFAITMTESNTTTARIDSELALEMANAGLDYVATIASVQSNTSVEGGSFWAWDLSLSKCRPNFYGNDKIFAPLTDGTYQLVFNMEDPLTPRDINQLLLVEKQHNTGKLVGCVVLFPDPTDPMVSQKFPDILVTSVGFVIESDDPDDYFLSSGSETEFLATRAVQAVLKEVSFYNYVYIYQNFTDLDLPFNVPDDYLDFMQNMVGFTPDTTVNGGVRADGVKDASGDYDQTTSDRVARLLIWDENGYPTTSSDPDNMATINGPVSLVSSDAYDGTGPEVADSMIGDYTLTENMKEAFQGYSTSLGADQRGVPGANEYFMGSIQNVSGFGYNANSTSIDSVAGVVNEASALSINNSSICQDGASDIGEDLNGDEEPDYSKNICKLSFSTEADGTTKVTVDIRNRYSGLTSEEGAAGENGDIDTLFSTGGCDMLGTTKKTYTLDQDAVIYVNGGNVMVEGEIGSGITVVCDDSRTAETDVTSSLDDLLGGVGSTPPAGYTQEEWDFFRHMETDDPQGAPTSEGNIFISGDITHEEDTLAAMGIISENYMYLHDLDSDPAELNVRAQLNSIRQSLQFDFFNYLKEDPDGTGDPDNFFTSGAGSANFNGTFNFEGQMVGKQTDVEGDIDGRGYSNINISYDDMLKYYSSPYFYNEDYSDIPTGTLQFAITGMFDMSSLSTTTSQP